MSNDPLVKLAQELAQSECRNKQALPLAQKSGLSKHFFYNLRDGVQLEVRSGSLCDFLGAINHPLLEDIKRHLAIAEASNREAT